MALRGKGREKQGERKRSPSFFSPAQGKKVGFLITPHLARVWRRKKENHPLAFLHGGKEKKKRGEEACFLGLEAIRKKKLESASSGRPIY